MRFLVDFVIAFTLLEGAVLVLRRRLTGRGLRTVQILPNLTAGLCLAVALRIALGGDGDIWILACLVGAGVAHALDMRAR